MSAEISQSLLQTAWKVPLEEEMRRFPELKQEDIDTVLEWCRQQPHLPQVSAHTAALFLLLSNFNIELAQTYIENHYTFRTYYRNIFADRDPLSKGIKDAMTLANLTLLEGLCHGQCRVMLANLKIFESSKFNPKEFSKLSYMILEKDVLDNGFTKEGYKLLMDATGFGLGHMTAITPSFLKQVFSYFLDGANVSIVEINIINVNVFVEKLVFLIKALTPPIVYERIKLYTKDKNALCLQKFPLSILPPEYGGQGKPVSELSSQTEEAVRQFRPWYLADEKYLRVDESKRPLNKQNKKVIKIQENLKSLELD
ncbi:hypothetical protein M8J76_012958 [Diaphorina citri]|nr:hypothetical protein M8J76_012958 [Diaphorina citri]KAI5724615.1 hypothetical protein M8J77_004996 [Diaphorina citri]